MPYSRSSAVVRIASSLTIASALAAQSPNIDAARRAVTAGLRVPIHSGEPDGGIAYGLWAAGPDYKASFHGDVTFIPYLGADYPCNRSLSWRTESIRVGDQELLADSPERTHTDYRFELRSESVTEAYDVRRDGLEQTFVLAERPAVAGDLVVSGWVGTDLQAAMFESEQRQIRFRDEDGRDILAYGEGTIIDSAGRTGAVWTSFDGERVTLMVPASWLDDAAYPVVLDPLLFNTVVSAGAYHSTADVAWDSQTDNVLLCHTVAASGSDKDAYGILMTGVFGSTTVVFSDATANWSTPQTACAITGVAPRRFGIALHRSIAGVGQRIRVHRHDPNSFAPASQLSYLNPPSANYNDWRVDIGGCDVSTSPFNPSGTHFLITWQRDYAASPVNTNASSIAARTLSASGVLGSEVILGAGSPLTSDFDMPDVTQQSIWQGGSNGRNIWMVCWQRCPTAGLHAGNYWRLGGALVDHTGSVTQGFDFGDPNDQYVAPKVAGQFGRYVVFAGHSTFAQTNFKSNLDRTFNARALRVDWQWGQSPSLPHAVNVVSTQADRNIRTGGVAYDTTTDSHWTVTYTDVRSISGFGAVYAVRLGYTGVPIESEIAVYPATSTSEGEPGGICYDRQARQFVVSGAMNLAFGGSTGHVEAVRYAYPAASVPIAVGPSCSAATIAWDGSQNTGSEFNYVRLGSAPGNQLAFLVVGLQSTSVDLTSLGLPGCFLLVPASGQAGHVGTATAVTTPGGAASFNMKLPEWLGPVDLYFQWFHLDGGTLESTRRIEVDIAR